MNVEAEAATRAASQFAVLAKASYQWPFPDHCTGAACRLPAPSRASAAPRRAFFIRMALEARCAPASQNRDLNATRAQPVKPPDSAPARPSDFQGELGNVRERGGVSVQHALGALVELLRGPAALGPRARLDVGAQVAPARDAAPPELAAQAIVARERGVEVAGMGGEGVGEALGVERGLGDAHADVRPRDERGITQKAGASDGEARRLDVEYRLEERLRALDQLGDVGRGELARVGLDARDQLGTDEGRRHGVAVVASRGV